MSGNMDKRWLAKVAMALSAGAALSTGAAQAQVTGDQRESGVPYQVFFDWGKAVVGQDGAATLDDVAGVLRQPGARTAKIVGHSDRSGPAGANWRSALSRAAAARDYLVSRGVEPGRVVISSRGEDALFIATADGVREPQNRRVDVTISAPADR